MKNYLYVSLLFKRPVEVQFTYVDKYYLTYKCKIHEPFKTILYFLRVWILKAYAVAK